MSKKISIIIVLLAIIAIIFFAYKNLNKAPVLYPEQATSTIVHTAIGQKSTGLNISITPNKIISDSRCPVNVQCIWAGIVEVQTLVESENLVFELNKPQTLGNFIITLTDVTPAKTAGTAMADSAYRFTFEVKKSE